MLALEHLRRVGSRKFYTPVSFRIIRIEYFADRMEVRFARYANFAMPERDPCWRGRCPAFACGSKA
jgi:hypothetical protein